MRRFYTVISWSFAIRMITLSRVNHESRPNQYTIQNWIRPGSRGTKRLVYPVLHKPPGATITSRSAVRIRINFWRMVGLYISFGDWANALECWRSPSLRLVIPGIAVSPGVTHSDSRIVFVTGTVVKPQQPTTNQAYQQFRPGSNYIQISKMRRFYTLPW